MVEDFQGLVIRGATRMGFLVVESQDETGQTLIQHRNSPWMPPENLALKAVERKRGYSQTS